MVDGVETVETGDAVEQRSLRRRMAVAAVVTVIAVAGVAVLAVKAREAASAPGPLPVPVSAQPGAGTTACAAVMKGLPSDLAGSTRRTILNPTLGVAGWGDPAIVLQCGISTPEELTCSSALVQVNGVAWLEITDTGESTYIAVDRAVRIAFTIPDGVGAGAISQLSTEIGKALPAREVCVNGAILPPDGGN